MKIEVLDKGYVEFIEAWGKGRQAIPTNQYERDHLDYEVGIIEAARQSTQGSFRGWSEDAKLLATLFNHVPQHATPFEFAGMTIEVQAPLFVFREWHRHRTQSYNEMSARYAPLPDLYYHIPVQEVVNRAHNAMVSRNRQQQGVVSSMDLRGVEQWVEKDYELSRILEEHYQQGLKVGVPKEIARKKMPVDHYSRMRASCNLRNWLAFLILRTHKDAQEEIRRYATAVSRVVGAYFPQTWALFSAAANRTGRSGELEKLLALCSELCNAVDCESEDVGGTRPSLIILQDIGPLVERLEK